MKPNSSSHVHQKTHEVDKWLLNLQQKENLSSWGFETVTLTAYDKQWLN